MGGVWVLLDGDGRDVAHTWATYCARTALAELVLLATGSSLFAAAVPLRHAEHMRDDLPIGCGRLYLAERQREQLARVVHADDRDADRLLYRAQHVRHPRRRVYGLPPSVALPLSVRELRGGRELGRWTLERIGGAAFLEWS